MVVFFVYPVGVCRPVPAVEPKLPGRRVAAPADHQLFLPQQLRCGPDSGHHPVVRSPDWQPPPPQGLQKAGRRRVYHHPGQVPAAGQPQQVVGILPVGLLPALGPGIVVVFRRPVPHVPPPAPQAEGGRIYRPVVAGDPPLLAVLRRRLHPALVPEVVHQPLRGGPLAQHEPPVEAPLKHPLVPLPHPAAQPRVVRHSKVQVEHPLFLRLAHPFPIEPVARPLWVAAQPYLASRRRAPGRRLLHKGAGHQRRLVQQRPGQGNSLNQGGAALVAPAVQEKGIFPAAEGHGQSVFAAPLPDAEPHVPQHGQHAGEHIALHRRQRGPAQGELSPLEPRHGPAEKGQAQAQGLAAAHRAVAEDSVPVQPGGAVAPPTQHLPLLGGESPDAQPSSAPGVSFRARKNSSAAWVSLRSIKSRIISSTLI